MRDGMMSVGELAQGLLDKIENKTIQVGIVGLGYVGLPLATHLAIKGYNVCGYDVDPVKVEKLSRGQTYLKTVSQEQVTKARDTGTFRATANPDFVKEVDAVIICVPTPLDKNRTPDLSYVEKTAEMIAPRLREGQIVSLESTTYPGTTNDLIKPILESGGLTAGKDFFLAYSPEREDPGNVNYNTTTTPKVVGGLNADSLAVATRLYACVVDQVVPVDGCATAEAVKLTENIFRSVNIALVNELKVIFDKMGLDIWTIIDAAKTKPFGYMPFYPGPGLGGHCIPIDPFYLSWKAREFDVSARFIELAGEINTAMPSYVVQRLHEELDSRLGRSLKGAKILVVGLAYKKNVDDTRESPAFPIIRMLKARGAVVDYLDPHVPSIPKTREHPELAGQDAVPQDQVKASGFDAALIATDHDLVDYQALVDAVPLVVDTRNATKSVTEGREKIVKA